jgi:hypothetical protein
VSEAASPLGGANEALRSQLFAMAPIEAWPTGDEDAPGVAWAPPWSSFVQARQHLADGDQDLAIRAWSQIANPIAGWEPRHVLQAWRFLQGANVHPDASIAGEVLGVVVEVAIDGSHDVLAAYADGSVRMLHHLGGATIIEAPLPADGPVGALRPLVGAVLVAGQGLADQIGPWTEPQLPPLPAEHSRLTMLTRLGPCFGQGPDQALAQQPGADQLFAAATALFAAVVELPRPDLP